MVLRGEGDYMATTRHERSSKTLHNFSLPNLKWGSHRNLRCIKVESEGTSSVAGVDQRLRRRSSPSKPFRFGGGAFNRRAEPWKSSENGAEEGIEEFREKIMSDLRTVADKMTESIFRKQGLSDEEEEDKERQKEELESPEKKKREKEREVSPPEAPGVTMEVRPWNLRKRRAACKAPLIPETGNCDGNQYNNHKGLGIIEEKRVNSSILGYESANSTRSREKKERPKLVLTLSKKEIEDDYMEIMGHRPPRRPKKRPRNVQKQVDVSRNFPSSLIANFRILFTKLGFSSVLILLLLLSMVTVVASSFLFY